MSLDVNAPPQWETFVQLTKQNMPVLPQMNERQSAQVRSRISKALNVVTALLGGAGISLPTQIDHLVNSTVSDSAGAMAQSTAQTLALQRLGASGGIVGGGVETLRGGYQQLNRGHDALEYLLEMSGYVTTLAGMSITAMMANRHDTPYPVPQIPTDIVQSGDLFSSGRRAKYIAGVNRAWRIITQLDNIRPADSNADYYSKSCLTHIAINTGNTRVAAGYGLQVRKACESLIASEILNNNLRMQREQLRRWARS